MSKFKKEKSKEPQAINTSSLPDIIFMLLFFFMVATTMRQEKPDVSNKFPISSPSSTDLIKDKNKLKYIYIGFLGDDKKNEKIQLNDDLYNNEMQVSDFVQKEISKVDEAKKNEIRIALKVDQNADIGFISKVEDQIRLAKRYKILYSTIKSDQEIRRDMSGL